MSRCRKFTKSFRMNVYVIYRGRHPSSKAKSVVGAVVAFAHRARAAMLYVQCLQWITNSRAFPRDQCPFISASYKLRGEGGYVAMAGGQWREQESEGSSGDDLCSMRPMAYKLRCAPARSFSASKSPETPPFELGRTKIAPLEGPCLP